MRHKILVQEKTVNRDEYGAESISYTTVFTLKAAVKYVGGSKGTDANEIFTTNTVVFETHYRDINEEMIILFKDQKYRINYIAEVGYRSGLQITAEKINE